MGEIDFPNFHLTDSSQRVEARRRAGSAVERAAEYGIDVGLLRDRLRLSPAERLRRLEADRTFILKLRGEEG